VHDKKLASRAELEERGRAARDRVPLAEQARFVPGPNRPDPVALLEEQARTRYAPLVPVRHGRMMVSPATFYRGAALPMASDLATTPRSGIDVQLGGDAHLSNFGLFASPERDLLFDMNDFDETLVGPWEWDVKRLATSFVVSGRNRQFAEHHGRHAARSAVRSYRERMHSYASMTALGVYYSRVDVAEIMDFVSGRARPYLATTAKAASHHDALQEFSKLTEVVDGSRRIINRPPTILHPEDLQRDLVAGALDTYRSTLQEDRRALLDRFRFVDTALKVVGVGSVGLLAAIALMEEAASGEPLFLQAKEAEASVLERFLKPSPFPNHGQRVVAGQRQLQAASDVMLGWTTGRLGRQFYVRQLQDEKGSAVVEAMTEHDLTTWAVLCGWALARGHARSGDPALIAAYLGDDDQIDRAIEAFAVTYADQNETDYAAFTAAIKTGRLQAQSGV